MTLTQELLRFAGLAKLHPPQVIEGIRGPKLGKLSLPSFEGRDHPEEDGITSQESPSESLCVAGVQLLTGERAAERSAQRASENGGKAIVQPDYARGARPDQISHGPIVAVDDPAFGFDGGGDQ